MDVHLANFSLFREAGPRDGVQEAGPRDDGVQEAVLLSGYHQEESSTSSAQFTLWGVLR